MIKHGWLDLVMSYVVHSPELYSYAARVVSAAAQSNPPVQAYCIEKGSTLTLLTNETSLFKLRS